MTIFKNIRLGLLHLSIAISFVAITGVLNRIMIHDLGVLSTIVAALVILPYVLSPAQVWIGQYSDTHPIWGYRRTPYILVGAAACFLGMVLTPHAALLLAENLLAGILSGIVAFGLWGMGYNLAVVSYLSLASDLSDEENRSRTIAVMWFMMIAGIIASAIIMGRALEPYSNAQLFVVFQQAAAIGMGLVILSLAWLEPRRYDYEAQSRESQKASIQAVLDNPQARMFFIYLVLMLVAILGQDVLLEPFGAAAFEMTVEETTQLTALWGGMTLISLLLYGFVMNRFMTKRQGAVVGGLIAMSGLILIGLSGMLENFALFQPGIAVLGFGTGIATATNLGLMLDMTTPEQAGLFIGAWGVADAMSRGIGMMLGGMMRDVVTLISGDVIAGYVTVFFIEAGFLVVSLLLLSRISVAAFHKRKKELSFSEMAAVAGDA